MIELFEKILRESEIDAPKIAFDEAAELFDIPSGDRQYLYDGICDNFADDVSQYGNGQCGFARSNSGIDATADGWLTLMSFAFDEYLEPRIPSYKRLVSLYRDNPVFRDAIDSI